VERGFALGPRPHLPDDGLFPERTSGAGEPAAGGPAPAPAAASLRVAPNPARAGESARIAAPIAWAGAPVDIVDVSGRVVRRLTLIAGGAAGRAEADWDGRDERGRRIAAGVYHGRLTIGETSHAVTIVRLP